MAKTIKTLPAMPDSGSIPGSGRSSGEGNEWLSTLVFLPEEFHGQRSLVGYSPQGHKEPDMTEQPPISLSFFFQRKRQMTLDWQVAGLIKRGELRHEALLWKLQNKYIFELTCWNFKSLYSMWVLTGFSHVFSPDGLNNTSLSPGCILEAASSFGRQAKHTFQDRGWGEEALSSQVNPQSHPLHDSL